MLPRAFDVVVEDVRLESPDTATLLLAAPDRPEYLAGQHLSLDPHQFPQLAALTAQLEAQKGKKELPRKYSLSSAPHEPLLAITVKEEEPSGKYPPLLSGLLVRGLPRGTRFGAFGFMGPFVLREGEPGLVVHVVAGSGAAPGFGIVKDALHRRLPHRHVWLASNKRRADVLFHDALLELQRAHPDKLHVENTLTRENVEGFGCGRITRELLERLIPSEERPTCQVFACGPAILPWDRKAALEAGTDATPRFMESVMGFLNGMGIPPKRIHRETWG